MANEDDRLFRTALHAAAEELGLTLTTEQVDAMARHLEAVRGINRLMNLTRITAPVAAAVRHYADSLAAPAWCQVSGQGVTTVLDIGTGAGYPALPVAIYRPDWQVTAIDSTAKKIAWLARHLEARGPSNCRAMPQRAEHWPPPVPHFDLILCRAIGPAAECVQAAARVCPPRGVVVCYKTMATLAQERREAERTARRLGYEALPPWPYRLSEGAERLERQLLCYRRNQVPSP